MNTTMPKQYRMYAGAPAWVEPAVLLLTILIMDLIYGMPQLINDHFSFNNLREILADALIIFIACIPGWWLHFRKFTHAGLKHRVLLHFVTATIYYSVWLLTYLAYNSMTGKPVMTGAQVLQNLWHNILFYIQAFCFLHIYHYFSQREEQIQREKEIRKIAYETEIAGLKAQIQPHFLFNTLNSISASVPAQQEHTRELIARLADIFRYALAATEADYVSLREEIEFIRTYLSLEQQRFGARLQVKVHLDPEVADVRVPSMLFQPLVENALKHGIEPSLSGGAINISITKFLGKVKIRVSNTGLVRTFDAGKMLQSRGVGLRNTATRLNKLYNESLEVTNSGDCLHFTFYVPILREEVKVQKVSAVNFPALTFSQAGPVFSKNSM